MEFQKIFKSEFINGLISKLSRNESTGLYLKENFSFLDSAVLPNLRIPASARIKLLLPDSKSNYDFENSVLLFDEYKSLTPTESTDGRLWTYLAHVDFWEYMQKRWPIENKSEDKRGEFILEHWFLNPPNAVNLTRRHGISTLWWGAYMTYDSERENPFELTKELFSMLDYASTLISGSQGRNKNFTHAVLEFVIENKKLFSNYKEARVRLLMRKVNYSGGYKILPSLSKIEIKKICDTYKNDLEKVLG